MKQRFHSSTLAIVATMLLCSPAWSQGPPPMNVLTEKVRMMEFHDQVYLIGRTEARHNSRIVAEVSGRVVSIDAGEGNRIAAGAALVTIGSERLRLSLSAKEAETKQARAQAEVAERNFLRTKDLFSRELISESNIDLDSAQAVAARERYNQLQAERDQIAHDVGKCTIKAPFDGYTGRQLVSVGEWVNPGTPVFEMIDPSQIKVTVDLPERYFGQLSIGGEVEITVSSAASRSITGRVTGISPSAVEATHTFPVIVTVNNRDGRLGGGMLVKATLSLKNNFTSLAVSKDAIVREGLQTKVFKVVDGKAVPVTVLTSSTQADMIAVSGEGLSEGIRVVVRGNERIFPGSPVQIVGEDGKPLATDGKGKEN